MHLPIDPYKAEAVPELDALSHVLFLQEAAAAGSCPAYSTDNNCAKRVLARLRAGTRSVIVGRTSLEGRSWFARFERNAMDGTEVFADTFELAVCRLALLLIEEIDSGK